MAFLGKASRYQLAMGGTATTFLVALLLLLLLRRRISRRWIDLTSASNTSNKKESLPWVELDDLSRKVVVITGGSSGLGYEAARDLVVARGCTVVMGCRDEHKGREAAKRILLELAKKRNESGASEATAAGAPEVECLPLDLASLRSVVQFADAVASRHAGKNNIRALLLNAGVWVPMKNGWRTADGYEIHFGVNHLAHLLLALRLLPHLQQQSIPSRIIWVSSSLLKYGVLDFDKQDFVREGRRVGEEEGGGGRQHLTAPNKKEPALQTAPPSYAPTGYCDSKLMNALSCRHLASLLEEKDGSAAPKVATYAVCPGFCRTDLGRNVEYPWWKRALLSPVFWLIQRTARQGACNLVFACAASDREARRPMLRGRMYRDGALLGEANDAVDLLAQQDNAPARLWDLSVSLLEETLGAGLDSK